LAFNLFQGTQGTDDRDFPLGCPGDKPLVFLLGQPGEAFHIHAIGYDLDKFLGGLEMIYQIFADGFAD